MEIGHGKGWQYLAPYLLEISPASHVSIHVHALLLFWLPQPTTANNCFASSCVPGFLSEYFRRQSTWSCKISSWMTNPNLCTAHNCARVTVPQFQTRVRTFQALGTSWEAIPAKALAHPSDVDKANLRARQPHSRGNRSI